MTEDLAALRFNRAVAQIYTLRQCYKCGGADVPGAVRREALETLVLLIGADDAASGGKLLGGAGA